MKPKIAFVVILISFFLVPLFLNEPLKAAENSGPNVGDKAPLLQATDLLQVPSGTKLDGESTRGKVVILEFWATWCAPCIAAIPHLNELAEEFKGKPVRFIAVTEEDKETVTRFLAKMPIKAWIALDTKEAMNRAYSVEAIPRTVLLGKDGKIAAITDPSMLTSKVIVDLLADKHISLPEPVRGAGISAGKTPGDENQTRPVFQILIQPSSHTNTVGFTSQNGSITAAGYTLGGALPLIFNINADRIVTRAPLPKGLYDFVVTQPWPPEAGEDVDTLLQAAVKSAFGLKVEKQTNYMNAFILRAKESNARNLTVSATEGMDMSTSISSGVASVNCVGVSIAGIASFLEDRLGAPVIDETGLTNRYDASLKWQQASWAKPNLEGMKQAITEQLGLELVADKCPIERIVIDRVRKDGN